MHRFSTLVSAIELRELDGESVWLDVRPGPKGRAAYDAGHVQGALYVDLETELSPTDKDVVRQGRHPLPDAKEFARFLGTLGIEPHMQVVVYDDQSGAFAAARAWWMLRSLGHAHVAVLDGGIQALVANGVSLSQKPSKANAVAAYPSQSWQWPTIDMQQVEALAHDTHSRLIDVRSADRYRGENEPMDPVAGHIPGAINIPYTQNLTPQGTYKTPADLKTLYAQVTQVSPEHTAIYCGSGVTACHTLLALEHAGIPGAALYVGSFSQWCRSPKPIATV